jgi:hypothetical protein
MTAFALAGYGATATLANANVGWCPEEDSNLHALRH